MTKRLEARTEIHFGKPCLAGTRIPVEAVLELVRDQIPLERIRQDFYPELTADDIAACIQYALDVVRAEEVVIGTAA